MKGSSDSRSVLCAVFQQKRSEVKEEHDEDWYIAGDSEGEAEDNDPGGGKDLARNKREVDAPAAKRQKVETGAGWGGRGLGRRNDQMGGDRGQGRRQGRKVGRNQHNRPKWQQRDSLSGRKHASSLFPEHAHPSQAMHSTDRAAAGGSGMCGVKCEPRETVVGPTIPVHAPFPFPPCHRATASSSQPLSRC